MYIGLYDQEIVLGKERATPSLELMLISSYYKKDNVVEMFYDISDIEKYDLVYFRRDRTGESTTPYEIFSNPKVQWFGCGFTGDFVGIEDKFHKVKPDKTIYYRFYNQYKNKFSDRQKAIIRRILSKDYYLLRLTNKSHMYHTKDELSSINGKIIIFDDSILENKNFIEIFKNLEGCGVYFLNSQRTTNYENFKYLLKRKKIIRSIDRNRTVAIYHGNLSKEEFLDVYEDLSMYYGLGFSYYNNSQTPENFMRQELKEKGGYFMYSRALGKHIKIFQTPVNSVDLLGSCSQLLSEYARFTQMSGLTHDGSFLTFAEKSSKILQKEIFKYRRDIELYPIIGTNLKCILNSGRWKI